MKSIIPTTLSLFWINILLVLVIFQHAECKCGGDDTSSHLLPTYCCKDLEIAVIDFCGEDNYEIDYDSDEARGCCYKGCTGYGLSLFCISPVDLPPYPRFCCADFEIAVATLCGVDNYIIDPYSTEVRDCCNEGCAELQIRSFCIIPVLYPEPELPIYCCDNLEEAVSEVCGDDNYDSFHPYGILEEECCINGCDEFVLEQFCLSDTFETSDTTSTSDTSTDTTAQTTNTQTAETTDPEALAVTDPVALQTTNPTPMETTDPNPTTP